MLVKTKRKEKKKEKYALGFERHDMWGRAQLNRTGESAIFPWKKK